MPEKSKTMMIVGVPKEGGGYTLHASPVHLGAPVLTKARAISLMAEMMALPRKPSLS